MQIAKRSQKQFAAQWEHTGTLNGHIEEMHTGRNIVKVFGREEEAERDVRRGEREALRGELQGAVHLGHHPAVDELHQQPQLRRHRRHRRAAGRVGHDVARRRAGVHPVLAPVHVADHAAREHRERHAVGGRLGRARLRAARRGRGGARHRDAASRSTTATGRIDARGRLVPLQRRRAAHRGPRPRREAGPDGRDRRPDRRRQDHARQPAAALLRDRRRHASASTASTRAT